MAKSKILKELANGEIGIDVALKRLMILANDLYDDELAAWVDKELSGYEPNDELPGYRQMHNFNFQYSGINGSFRVSDHPLPHHYLQGFDGYQDLVKMSIREPIGVVITKSLAKERFGRDLTFLAGYVNDYIGIQCFKIQQIIDNSFYADVIENVKHRALKVLMKLDREYGNLDDLDINTDSKTQEQIDKTKAEVRRIIYSVTISKSTTDGGE